MSDINRIEELATFVAAKIPQLIGEATDQINESIEAAVVAAQEAGGDKEAVLKLPISVSWNMDTNKVEVALGVNVRHKFTRVGELSDPDQQDLRDGDGKPLTGSLASSVRKLARAVSEGGAK